jgi:lysophospholipase L1-like esterase
MPHDRDDQRTSRRDFVLAGTGLTAAGLAALSAQAFGAEPSPAGPMIEPADPLIEPGDTVLFQGDSITDAGRSRKEADQPNNQQAIGNGYAWMAAGQLLVDRADDNLKVFNRGISGHKVFQLADRWQRDCFDLKPDVLSILIGVNDIWHMINGKYDGTVEIYQRDYNTLLERTKNILPRVKLVVCEPFVLRCGAVNDKWFPAFDACRAAARRVAEKAGAVFVPFQSTFDTAVKFAPPEHWAKDGVHPSTYGNALMAHAWLEVVAGS